MNKLLAAALGALLTLSCSQVGAADEPPAVAKLIEKLREPDVTARPKTAKALGTYGSAAKGAVADLGKLLRQETSNILPSQAAAEALARIGAAAVPELAAALKNPAAVVRVRAAWALGMIGPDAEEAMPALIKALGDRDKQVRQLAAYALGEMGPKAEPAVVPLVGMLRDPAARPRQQAAASLRRIGTAAVPALVEALKDKRAATREAAAHALSLLGPDAKSAMEALAEATRDKHDGTRIQAIAALGGIGPEAKKAAPALLEALRVKHVETQGRAAAALLAIGAGTDEELAATMREITRKVRWATPPVLAQFGRKPKDAVRPLILALKDDEPNQRAAAAVTLGNIGRDAKEAVPALKKALEDPDVRVRLSAAGALPLIDEKSHKEAVKAFDEILTQMENRQIALLDPIQARLAQIQAQLDQKQAQLGQRPQAVYMAAFADPMLQSYCNEVVGTFIVAMSTVPPHVCSPRLNAFQELARKRLLSLGAEAVPALVQGANIITDRRLGFI
jgi:HEAT repeat protein